MGRFWVVATRQTNRLRGCIGAASFLLAPRPIPSSPQVAKCFLVRATSALFKNYSGGSRDCGGGSTKSVGNPCQSENVGNSSCAKYPSKKPCGSSKAPTSGPDRCSSKVSKPETTTFSPLNNSNSKICKPTSSPRSGITRPASLPSNDDPCGRECKLSHPTPRCQDNSKLETCGKPPTDICPPTGENARKLKFWRAATIFGALPAVLIASIIILKKAEEEACKPRPEFVPMEYMYRRIKPFPWGDGNHTLFHNPIKNAVPPDGYEVEDPNAVPKS